MRYVRVLVVAALVVGGCKGDEKQKVAQADPVAAADRRLDANVRQVLEHIAALETKKDVTCWTSFRQLDWFIAEKGYSEFATLAKITAVKALVRALWAKGSAAGRDGTITAAEIAAAAELPAIEMPKQSEDELVTFANDIGLQNYTDYQKTAEHWRVVLAVLLDEIRHSGGGALRPLEPDALEALADAATTLSLLLLKESSAAAEADKSQVVEGEHVAAAHRALADRLGLSSQRRKVTPLPAEAIAERLEPVTRALIDGKVKALQSFNKGSKEITADLNRVSRLPLTPEATQIFQRDLQSFVHFVAAGFEPMRADNYLSDGSFAKTKLARKAYLDELQVQNVVMQLFPHHTLANGDVLVRFEPNPGPITRRDLAPFDVKMLDHEMNGVRDSAVQWIAMRKVHEEKPFAMDPFAAEYLSEVVSMMMTLWIARAEQIAADIDSDVIDAQVAARVRDRAYVMVPPPEIHASAWSDEDEARKRAALSGYPAEPFREATRWAGLPTSLPEVEALTGVTAHVDPERIEGDDTPQFDLQTIMGGGIAVGDVNRDGYPDLYLTGEKLGRLYLNRGASAPGRFRDRTEWWGLPQDLHDGHGALFFDLEGDGDQDLVVLRSDHRSALFRFESGKFVDVAERMGLETGRGAHVAHVFDYDRDGDLDLYVGYYGSKEANESDGSVRSLPSLDGRNGSPNQLWRNDGGTFTEVGVAAGVADVGWTLAVSSFDHDRDGDLDLYLANDFGPNRLLRNNGDGTFADITDKTGTGDRGSGMNVDVSDVDGDGRWDVYVTNIDMFSKRIKVVFPRDESTIDIDEELTRSFQYLSGNKLYVSEGSTGYRSEEATRLEPGDRGWGWDASFFDYDNDGDDDLYLTNGWIEGSYAGNQKNQFFVNEGGRFFQAPGGSPEAFAGNTRSAAAVDIDLDGDVDLVTNQFRQPPRVLLNTAPAKNRWIRLRLVGRAKNPKAIGATVEIRAGGRTVLRQVSGGRGYLSQSAAHVLAGLGDAREATVSVHWPDGTRSEHAGLGANEEHTLEQPAAAPPEK